MGFYDRRTGEVNIRQGYERAGATATHEFLHKAQNPVFRSGFGRNWNEAATEHYNNQICRPQGVDTAWSRYNRDGRVRFMDDVAGTMGEGRVKQAFFGQGREDARQLAVDINRRLGSGTFQQMRQRCNAGDYDGARALLRERLGARP